MHKQNFWSKVNHIVGFILFTFISTYFIWSVVNIIADFNDELKVSGQILNIISLTVELMGFLVALYFAVQLIDGVLQVGEVPYDLSKITGKTKISVIVPIHNVQPSVLEETLIGFTNQTYKNFDLWVADDSTDKELKNECEKISAKHNYTYYYEPNKNFKSGMVNIVIPKTDGDLIALFDVDHIPEHDILEKFVAIMEQYPEYVFIQAKFGFRNAKNHLHIWEAMGLTQCFCSQNARRELGTVLYSGTSAIFRREREFSLPEGKLTEDYDLSVELILQGKKGYFLDEIGSMSLVPETMTHQMSQMYRWMCGQAGIMSDHTGHIIKNIFKRKVGIRQAIDVIFSSMLVLTATSFYFLGVFYVLLYFLRIPMVRAWYLGQLWLIIILSITFVVYIATITATTIYSMKSATFPLKIWHVPFFLTFGSFTAPFLLIAALNGIVGRNKLIPGKTQWNRKIPVYRWASIFSLIGIFFVYVAVDSLLQQLIFLEYPNFFFILFAVIGSSLAFSLPFIYITTKIFKPKIYEDKHIYH